jgi:hypothetical protein
MPMNKQYPCRTCGEPIIFRFPKNGDDGPHIPKPKQQRKRNKPVPIHINGRCGQRGFRF